MIHLSDLLNVATNDKQRSVQEVFVVRHITEVEDLHTVSEVDVVQYEGGTERGQGRDYKVVGRHQDVLDIVPSDLYLPSVEVAEAAPDNLSSEVKTDEILPMFLPEQSLKEFSLRGENDLVRLHFLLVFAYNGKVIEVFVLWRVDDVVAEIRQECSDLLRLLPVIFLVELQTCRQASVGSVRNAGGIPFFIPSTLELK